MDRWVEGSGPRRSRSSFVFVLFRVGDRLATMASPTVGVNPAGVWMVLLLFEGGLIDNGLSCTGHGMTCRRNL